MYFFESTCCCWGGAATTLVVAVIGYFLYTFYCDKYSEERARLRGLVKRKQDERLVDLSRLRLQHKFGPVQQKIMGMPWKDLVSALQKRELSAVDVLEAHMAKAITETDKCNAVTEFIPLAHIWAKELDDLAEVKGPLHGIPFCVKDDASVVGMDASLGLAKFLYNPATESAVIVKVLQDLGAVPFCKTNVPQTLFSYDSDNHIFGRTLNGWNNKFRAGGSSGGTAALVASGAAHFGTGSDIGGSLRIPAHFNGLASIKTTPGRLSLKRSVPPVDLSLSIGIKPSLGIIAQTPHIVSSVFKKMIQVNTQSTYDKWALPIPWNEAMYESKKNLRIGYFTSIPFMPTVGDSGDVVLKAKEALESLGHTLVPFELPDLFPVIEILNAVLVSGISKQLLQVLKFEDIGESIKPIWYALQLPGFITCLLKKIISSKAIPFLHSRRLASLMGSLKTSTHEYGRALEELSAHRQEIETRWKKLGLDCVISNVFHAPAPTIDSPPVFGIASPSPYTMLWNLLEYPAGVVPFGTETGNKFHEYNDEGDALLKIGKKNLKGYVGAPIGVQIIGSPCKEEMVLRVMDELEPFNTFKNQRIIH